MFPSAILLKNASIASCLDEACTSSDRTTMYICLILVIVLASIWVIERIAITWSFELWFRYYANRIATSVMKITIAYCFTHSVERSDYLFVYF